MFSRIKEKLTFWSPKKKYAIVEDQERKAREQEYREMITDLVLSSDDGQEEVRKAIEAFRKDATAWANKQT